jgi:hypothetical protein
VAVAVTGAIFWIVQVFLLEEGETRTRDLESMLFGFGGFQGAKKCSILDKLVSEQVSA